MSGLDTQTHTHTQYDYLTLAAHARRGLQSLSIHTRRCSMYPPHAKCDLSSHCLPFSLSPGIEVGCGLSEIAAPPPSLLVVLKNMPVVFDTTLVVATILLMFECVGDGTVVR